MARTRLERAPYIRVFLFSLRHKAVYAAPYIFAEIKNPAYAGF